MSQEPELEAMSKVLTALQSLDEGAQTRVVRWAIEKLKLPIAAQGAASGGTGTGTDHGVGASTALEGVVLPASAALWAKQNGITAADLETVFHIAAGNVELISSHVPGKSNKERVLSCYILAGVLELLRSGDASFSDKAARSLCEAFGCFDSTNHAKYLNDRGNEFTGSKDKGWTLTAPGKKRAAALVKTMNGGAT